METRLLSTALICLSGYAVWKRMKSGTLLTAAGGLHLSMFLSFGCGMFAYTWSYLLPVDSAGGMPVVEAFPKIGVLLLGGYTAALLLERWQHQKIALPRRRVLSPFQNISLLMLVWMLAIVGTLTSDRDIAHSGVGTILVILKMFEYSAVVLAIKIVKIGRVYSLVVLTLVVAVSGYLAVVSPWRSEIIFLAASISLGFALRGRRTMMFAPLLLVASIVILLPFANEKKTRYEQVVADPVGAFESTLTMPLYHRMQFMADFWGNRVDGARELAFVVDGLDSGLISLRHGLSYWEAIEQLIPRAIWPDKPSFNQENNYLLSRSIGLVSWNDEQTSWGVNYFAETVWNFGVLCVFWVLPVGLAAANWLDRQVQAWLRHALLIWLLEGALFFKFMDLVGVANTWEYVLWLCFVGLLIDRLAGIRGSWSPHSTPVPTAVAPRLAK